MDSADLEMELVADFLEVLAGGGFRQFDVDGSADCGTQVGGAEGQVAEAVVPTKGNLGFDGLDTTNETVENGANIAAFLHGNETQVIFLIDPDKEGLVVVVEDSTSLGPEVAGVGVLQMAIAFFELKLEKITIQLLLYRMVLYSTNRTIQYDTLYYYTV